MATSLKALNFAGQHSDNTVDKEPNECPHCHNRIKAQLKFAILSGISQITIKAVFGCPDQDCRENFLAIYKKGDNNNSYQFSGCIGGSVLNKDFGQEIKDISEDFIQIYNEALEAEKIGLEQITGVGFRKALEFLIKDYSIKSNSTDSDKIKRMNLSQVIENYISDPRIKEVSKRAVWLGNDETHYTRIWEDKTVTDIKLLIELTVFWIKAENLTERLKMDMPDPKGK